ncbi:glycine betaine ABC transporter substrate-binding protein [Geomonas sp.]|uniref:glycine betaine ABC transporter substrate-binding protein n=1 Tax=Geomonas sp. TaxID=2651584 RepID=UPI002B4806DD|nr:glycine betaine ABC transporter substrate-binding protein [Geomonas sp.]HJV34014.1 glycine betaine ABC transporter substrate-binding protein [Geomonas sp.]
MRKVAIVVLVLGMFLLQQGAQACVGKTLVVGIGSSPAGELFAEMISVLVNERTGTSVKIVSYKDSKEMYAAVKRGEVGIVIEQADQALKVLAHPAEASSKAAYDTAKKEYRKTLSMVWLEPFGSSQYYAPVLTLDTIGNLPALPKLVSKLGGVVNDQTCAKLLKSVSKDQKARTVAKDFLKSKKLI